MSHATGLLRSSLTDVQREALPYVVLVTPDRTRGAAYNSRRALVVDDVSPELLRFAITRHVHMELWEPGLDRGPQERPEWMPRQDLQDWLLFWVRDEFSSADDIARLPMR